MHHLLITISAPDQVGLVSSVAAALFDLGGDLGEVSFADIAGEARFSAAVELPRTVTAEDVHAALAGLPVLKEARLDITPTASDLLTDAPLGITHIVECEGNDQPGFLARITETLIDYTANIARLDSSRKAAADRDGYRIIMYLTIPEQRASACLAALDNVAQSLGCRFQVESVEAPES